MQALLVVVQIFNEYWLVGVLRFLLELEKDNIISPWDCVFWHSIGAVGIMISEYCTDHTLSKIRTLVVLFQKTMKENYCRNYKGQRKSQNPHFLKFYLIFCSIFWVQLSLFLSFLFPLFRSHLTVSYINRHRP
jgi:hypothetical protein